MIVIVYASLLIYVVSAPVIPVLLDLKVMGILSLLILVYLIVAELLQRRLERVMG